MWPESGPEDVPHSASLFVEIFLEAGLPPGVINLVHGGPAAGKALVEHPDVPVLSFTGSTEVGALIGETGGRMHKRVSLEMGGKNAMTVLGDGLKPESQVGPLINRAALEKVESYIGIAKEEGCEIACGGARATGGALDDGFFFRPTVLLGVRAGMRVEQEEIFGPVLSVVKVRDLEEAIRVNNGVRYGLSSALYTRDAAAAFRAMTDFDNGITYVNAPTIGAEAHLPFGGTKQTGNGHREGGWEVYDFYTETKVVYVDYSGRLQRAQIDTYAE